jgi:putative oxidoreductase
MRKFLFLSQAQRFSDFALLLLRIFVGLFLIWSVWDHLSSPERMQEFVGFLEKHEFPSPRLLAPLSVYLQLAIGIAFVLGLVTRWAGIFCVITFVVAIAMVDRFGGVRGVFPSGCLVFVGLYLATHGAGRYSLDAALGANEAARRASGGVRLMR